MHDCKLTDVCTDLNHSNLRYHPMLQFFEWYVAYDYYKCKAGSCKSCQGSKMPLFCGAQKQYQCSTKHEVAMRALADD